MENKIWRLDANNLAVYVECPEIIRKIRRSRPDWIEMATYSNKDGIIFARQYRIDSSRKRSARRLLGVNVT